MVGLVKIGRLRLVGCVTIPDTKHKNNRQYQDNSNATLVFIVLLQPAHIQSEHTIAHLRERSGTGQRLEVLEGSSPTPYIQKLFTHKQYRNTTLTSEFVNS